jgi:hypothetical protein
MSLDVFQHLQDLVQSLRDEINLSNPLDCPDLPQDENENDSYEEQSDESTAAAEDWLPTSLSYQPKDKGIEDSRTATQLSAAALLDLS